MAAKARRTHRRPVLEIEDSSVSRIKALELFASNGGRDPDTQAAVLATQFIAQNKGILSCFGVSADVSYDGRSVEILFTASTKVGALPLLSPLSGKPDYGLVVRPRFPWSGVGLMLGAMGWKVGPSLVKLPLLPQSDRKIPPWVLSTTILARIAELLLNMERRFEFAEESCQAPRGTVFWSRYATQKMPSARFLDIPCRFPDLRDDRQLLGAIHYTLRKQHTSLEGQRHSGQVVLQLLDLCQALLAKVNRVAPSWPTKTVVGSWYSKPFRADVFRDGLQAMEWTVDERGLAGTGDLQGLPWIMPMESFFEAWVETIVAQLSRRIGGTLRAARKRETISPIRWDPPYSGSQRYLVPDLVLEREDEFIVFDAKYKGHWEDINWDKWSNTSESIRDHHRVDMLQVLAYSTLSDAKKITCCLVYPCRDHTMESLRKRGRTMHSAYVGLGSRRVRLLLVAVPMNSSLEDTLATMTQAFQMAE